VIGCCRARDGLRKAQEGWALLPGSLVRISELLAAAMPYCAVVLQKRGGEVLNEVLQLVNGQLAEFPARVGSLVDGLHAAAAAPLVSQVGI
jgi:hypothetical protein